MSTSSQSPSPSPEQVHAALEVLRHVPFRELQKLGWHFQRNDFYSPLNDCTYLEQNTDLWTPREPRDIDMRYPHQEQVVREVGKYVGELRDIPQTSSSPTIFCWQNPFWNAADAMVQYGLMRARKPKRVVEIGCGWSSLLLARALTRNADETGMTPALVTQVEPYPRTDVLAALPKHWTLHAVPLQRAPFDVFESLSAGDTLFYDGSHCSKTASDVNWFFFEVLPRVKPGVLIHIHDIFFPEDYPKDWIFDRGQTWNEQYVLQAFLMNNPRYEVEIANRAMWVHRRPLLEEQYQGVQPAWGCSFWMTKK